SRARVIDYKTGALPAWKDVGTLYFQPLLYAYAVLMQMGRLSVPELRALYLETSRRPPRTLPAEKSQVLSFEAMKSADARAAHVDGRAGRRTGRSADFARANRRHDVLARGGRRDQGARRTPTPRRRERFLRAGHAGLPGRPRGPLEADRIGGRRLGGHARAGG